MFTRNGQALGSVQVDPNVSDPRKRPAKNAKATEPEPPPDVVDDGLTDTEKEADAQAEQARAELANEPAPAPEPEPKKAPAKKTGFQSALDKPKG